MDAVHAWPQLPHRPSHYHLDSDDDHGPEISPELLQPDNDALRAEIDVVLFVYARAEAMLPPEHAIEFRNFILNHLAMTNGDTSFLCLRWADIDEIPEDEVFLES